MRLRGKHPQGAWIQGGHVASQAEELVLGECLGREHQDCSGVRGLAEQLKQGEHVAEGLAAGRRRGDHGQGNPLPDHGIDAVGLVHVQGLHPWNTRDRPRRSPHPWIQPSLRRPAPCLARTDPRLVHDLTSTSEPRPGRTHVCQPLLGIQGLTAAARHRRPRRPWSLLGIPRPLDLVRSLSLPGAGAFALAQGRTRARDRTPVPPTSLLS